jgi:DNA modification methylase
MNQLFQELFTKRDGDIIRYPAVPVDSRAHPAQKPVGLVAALIGKSSQPGDVVFDPFAGAGTTFKACRDLDRIFVGCDLDPSYCQIDGTILRQGVLNIGIGS